jgi:hypothetical protein
MMGSFGLPELVLIGFIALFGGVLLLLPACLVCRKAGYPAWLGVGAILPLANILLLCFLGFAKWPVEHEVEALRGRLAGAG